MESGDEPSAPEPEEGPVLAPDELDISDDDHVTEIDDGRYVVSPEERTADEQLGPRDDAEAAEHSDDQPATAIDRRTVRAWLAEDLGGAESRYGYDVTASFGDAVRHRRMVSNDVVTIFESLVLWYAQQIDSTTPVEEVLGILLMEANVPVRYPVAGLQQLVESTDLGPDDTIADLVREVDDDEGFRL
jgi:hypothetical protein